MNRILLDAKATDGGGAAAAPAAAPAGDSKPTADPAILSQLNTLASENKALKEQISQFSGIDIKKLQSDSAELQKRLEKGDPNDVETFKKRLETDYKTRIENMEKENGELKTFKTRTLVNGSVMKHFSTYCAEGTEEDVERYVSQYCKWDEKLNAVVVVDDNGVTRYSQKNAGQPMTGEEFLAELTSKKKHFAKPSHNPGTMGGGSNSSVPGGGGYSGQIPSSVATNQKAAVEFFKANPAALQDFLNGGLKPN